MVGLFYFSFLDFEQSKKSAEQGDTYRALKIKVLPPGLQTELVLPLCLCPCTQGLPGSRQVLGFLNRNQRFLA